MFLLRPWTLVIGLILTASVATAGLFPFVRCDGGECKFCLASSAQGSNRVCSKPYSTNPGTNDPTPGFANISKELTEDLTHKLAKLKDLPEEGFDMKAFYEKFAVYSCDQADREMEFVQSQIEYLKWKLQKLQDSKKRNKCDKK